MIETVPALPVIDLRHYRVPKLTVIRDIKPIGRCQTVFGNPFHESGSIELQETHRSDEVQITNETMLSHAQGFAVSGS